MKKKDRLLDPTVDKFMTAFTVAQAESLVVVFKSAAIPEDEWKGLASVYAKAFQKSLKEALDEKDGNVPKGEG